MIVQCDQCNAKFRLDDSKVKEGGVKVRCSKCKNIFVVRSEAPAEEADFDSFLSGLMPPPPAGSTAAETTQPAAGPSDGRATAEPEDQMEMYVPAEERSAAGSEIPKQEDIDSNEFTFSEQPLGSEPAPSPAAETSEKTGEGFDLSEFSFGEETIGAETPPPPAEGEGKHEEELVFGELDLSKGEPPGKFPEGPAGEATDKEFIFGEEPAPSGPEFELNIEGLDAFGESREGVAPSPETSRKPEKDLLAAVPEEFSFGTEFESPEIPKDEKDFFAEVPPEFSIAAEDGEQNSAFPVPEGEKISKQSVSFDFGEFDFGETAMPEKGAMGMPMPESEGLEEQHAPEFSRILASPLPEMPAFEDELPPLSISSRRRGGSLYPIAVTVVCVLLVLGLAGGGFYFFKEGPEAFNKVGLGFMSKWFGVGSKEEGGISVRNTAGVFLNNKEVGEVFVINGEAVNNFSKPRASIQVKASLFGPKGEVLVQKASYCGNVLSREQLTTLPAAKLEAAMSNQFGDSLSNLAVQPGKGIPFVIVLTNVPKEVAEFGVEVVGSTVSTQ